LSRNQKLSIIVSLIIAVATGSTYKAELVLLDSTHNENVVKWWKVELGLAKG